MIFGKKTHGLRQIEARSSLVLAAPKLAIAMILGLSLLMGSRVSKAQPAPRQAHTMQNPWFSQPGQTMTGQKPRWYMRNVMSTWRLRHSIQKDIRAMGKISRKMYKELNKSGDHNNLKGKHVSEDALLNDERFAKHYNDYSTKMAAMMERGGGELFKASGLPFFKPAGEKIARSWRKEVVQRVFTRPLGAKVEDMAESPFMVAALFTHAMSNTGVGKWRNSKFFRAAKRATKNAMEAREAAVLTGDRQGYDIAETQLMTLQQAMGEGEYWTTWVKEIKHKSNKKKDLARLTKNNLNNEMINVKDAVENSTPTKQDAAAAAGALMTAAGAAYVAHQEGIKFGGKDSTFIADIDNQVNQYMEKFGDLTDGQTQETMEEFMRLRRQIGGMPHYINHKIFAGEAETQVASAAAKESDTATDSAAGIGGASAAGETIQVTDPDAQAHKEPVANVLDRTEVKNDNTDAANDGELSDDVVGELNEIVDNGNLPDVPVVEPDIEPAEPNASPMSSAISTTPVASTGHMAQRGKYSRSNSRSNKGSTPMERAAHDSSNPLTALGKAGASFKAGAKKVGDRIFSKKDS